MITVFYVYKSTGISKLLLLYAQQITAQYEIKNVGQPSNE